MTSCDTRDWPLVLKNVFPESSMYDSFMSLGGKLNKLINECFIRKMHDEGGRINIFC